MIAATGAALASAAAHASARRAPQPGRLNLTTCYLHDTLGHAHRVRFQIDGESAGVVLDPNQSRFGPSGEEIFRTQMEGVRATARVRAAPPARADDAARVLELVDDGTGALPAALERQGLPARSLRLWIGHTDCGPWRLLVFNEEGELERMVSLEKQL